MAYVNGNKPIVTNGLVYALDFGNTKSYTSGSNFANNIVYSPPIVTASVGPTGFNTNKILNTITNWRTTCTFSYTLENSGSITYQGGTPGRGKSFTVTQQDGPYTGGLRTYNSFLNNATGVVHITWVFAQSTVLYYVNGIPQPTRPSYTSLAASGNAFSFTTDTSKFKNFYVYDRALTWDEIYYNFTLVAKQYNIPVTPKPNYINESTYLFATACNITDPQVISSLETFTTALKSSSLWDKIDAIYPFIGTSSVSQKLNLKQPTNYDITTDFGIARYATFNLDKNIRFSGSFSLSTSGSKPNDDTSYLNPNYFLGNQGSYNYTHQSATNQHIAYLSYDQPQSSSFLVGVENRDTSSILLYQTEDAISSSMYTLVRGGITSSGVVGFVMGSRTGSSTFEIFKNNQSGSISAGTTASINYSTYFNCINSNNTASGISPYNVSYISVGDGFTPSQYSTYYNLVSQFQTNLKRQNTLLDNYSGAAAAYSLRRVGPSGYFGPAIRVRRDSDNALRDIGFTSDGQLDTVGLLDFVGVTGSGFVQTWYDQSGNGYDATQVTASNQPLVLSSGSMVFENKKPSLQFDGSDDGFVNNLTGSSSNYYLIGVANYTSGRILASYFYSGAPYFNFVSIAASTNYNFFARNASNISTSLVGAATTNNQVLQIGYLTSNSAGLLINNNTPVTSSPSLGSIAIGNGFGIGRDVLASSYNNGKIQEAIIYLSDQTTNRSSIQSNINSNYKIYGDATASFDPDYQAFITATGITEPTQSAALETLVSDLKSYGLWDKMKAVYPMVTDRNNRFAQSEDFSLTWNAVSSSVTANSTTAPNGTSTADLILEEAGTGDHYVYQTVTNLVSGNEYILSIYGKYLNRPWIALQSNDGAQAWFNIQTGLTGSFTGSRATITPVSGGWYRCALFYTASSNGAKNQHIHLADADGNFNYTGVATTGSYLWGAQFENGNLLGPYKATTATGFTTGSMLDQMKFNLKSTASFTGTYFGGWNPGYGGNRPNGTNGYMDTGLVPSTQLTFTSNHASIYCINNTATGYDLAASDDSGTVVNELTLIARYVNDNGKVYYSVDSAYNQNVTTTDSRGLTLGTLNGNKIQTLYKNTVKINTTLTSGDILPSYPLYLGGVNGGGTPLFFANHTYAITTIGDGLTDYQAKALYWIVQKFQTTLGRQVY